ncbi:hypothetical protein MLD38_006299 [Melastoma candidum]|uniref:Uncharacterized protein n=1 Tax=Melastoma candidum TaxID=119954 RepID=A0ACB9RLS4_9MYRT|nr:hypothetical protein MLD38_006299 [Melastoma candidum]
MSAGTIVLLLLISQAFTRPAHGVGGAAAGEGGPLEKNNGEVATGSSSSDYSPFVSSSKLSIQIKKGFRGRVTPMPRSGTTSSHTSQHSTAPLSRAPAFDIACSSVILLALFLL